MHIITPYELVRFVIDTSIYNVSWTIVYIHFNCDCYVVFDITVIFRLAVSIRYDVVISIWYNKTTQEGQYHANTVIIYARLSGRKLSFTLF